VLLLDEPTLGLDVQSARLIEQAIRRLVDEQGKAVLLTTHQMALAERLCDRVFVIHQGREVVEGPTGEVIERFGGQHQTVEIRLGAITDEATLSRIRQVFPLLSAATDGGTTVLTWSNSTPQRELLDLLELLDAEGLPISHVGRREATLEEVFVRLTSEGDSRV